MSSHLWLPPLNSHQNYGTWLSLVQYKEATVDESSDRRTFFIEITVDVNFLSELDARVIKGLKLTEEFSFPCCSLFCLSQENIANLISRMLNHMHVPFQLDNIIAFDQKHWASSWKRATAVDANSWIDQFQNFLIDVKSATHNENCNVLPLKLSITKNVSLPGHEFEAWISWLYEKMRADRSFPKVYHQAISRRRTIQELLDADKMFRGADKSFLDSIEENMMELDCDSESPSQCLVCLEEFSFGSKSCRLPCSHAFHKPCIIRWLTESNMCPLCRAPLPVPQPDST